MSSVMDIVRSTKLQYSDKGDYIQFHCLNPHHPGGDVHPSMTMLKSSGFFKCWSCGFQGGIKKFCRIMGGDISVAEQLVWNNDIMSQENHHRDYRILLTGDPLPVYENPTVMGYLRSRGVTDEFIEQFDLFYVESAQINGSHWTKRVCIPIYENGVLVNIEGRDYTREQDKKVLYPKGSKAGLIFNFDNLDFTKPVVLTEGIMDLPGIFPFYQNIGALFGNGLSLQQKADLTRIRNLTVIPDNDAGGVTLVNAIDASYDWNFRVGVLPEQYKDPGECPSEVLKEVVLKAVDVAEFVAMKMGVYTRQQKFDW